jgi:hypothetical protein
MDMIGRDQLDAALAALGELLAARGVRYELVLVGGGNLILRGLTTRPTTKDLDILASVPSTSSGHFAPCPNRSARP